MVEGVPFGVCEPASELDQWVNHVRIPEEILVKVGNIDAIIQFGPADGSTSLF